MDTTNSASRESTATRDVPGLKDALAQVVDGGLGAPVFRSIEREAFLDTRRREELSRLLADWDAASSTLPLEGDDLTVLHGFLELVRGDAKGAANTLSSVHGHPWGALFAARAGLALGRFEETAALLAKAKKLDLPLLRYAEAEAWIKLGKDKEAFDLVEGLREKDGESAEWAYTRARVAEVAGEYRDAIDHYRLAVERNRSFSGAWFRLGYLLDLYGTDDEERRDEAVHAYEECLRIVPVHTNAVINLGLIYEDRERYHDAVKCYEAVLRVHPNHPRARLYLGDALAATRMFYDRDQEKKADRHSQILKIPVTDFELSVRSRNCLQKMNIDTLGDLIMKTESELLSYKNFGETSLKEIKDMLNQKGLRLGQGLEDKGREPPSGRNPLEATAPAEVLDKPIDELNLSVRSRRCMDRLEVRTIRDLINKTEVELMSAKNFGMTSLNEIKRKLGELGLGLRS